MNVVDSSAWLEYSADGPSADFISSAIENFRDAIVPSVCIAEVFRRMHHQRGEDAVIHDTSEYPLPLHKTIAPVAADLDLLDDSRKRRLSEDEGSKEVTRSNAEGGADILTVLAGG